MSIYLSLLVCIVGALCYALASNPKVQQLGLCSYICGLLAFLLHVAPLLHLP